eukprot:s3117_g1.t1
MEHWSQSEEWKAQGWQSTARAASESRTVAPSSQQPMISQLSLFMRTSQSFNLLHSSKDIDTSHEIRRKFIEVPSALSASSTGRGRPEQQGKEAHDYEHSDWTWSWSSWHEDPGRTWENPTDWRQNQGEQGSTSEWTDWRGRGDDLNRWHSDRRQLRNPDVRLSHKQLLRCLEVSSGNSEFLAAVIPYVSLSASTLSLAAAPSTALDASGVVLGEAICRHSSFDLDQLSSLSRPASGRALKALLRQAEARFHGYFLQSFHSVLEFSKRRSAANAKFLASALFSADYGAWAMTKRAAETGLEFFSAWFCPYAQRAWIALEHHGLKYSKVEGLLPDAPGQDFKGYKKHPRLLENPKGLVPTLCEDGMPPVYESAVCVEYIDELAARSGGNSSLMPGSPAERAALRLKVLVRTSTDDRKAALETLKNSIDELEAWIQGPYILGKQLTAADIAFIPWAYRILHCKILERFRGPDYGIELATRPKLAKWLEVVMAVDAVKATLAEPEALCGTYKRYADNTALSKVAEAVRQGKTADSVDNLPDEAAEDEEVLVACLDRLADKAKNLLPGRLGNNLEQDGML